VTIDKTRPRKVGRDPSAGRASSPDSQTGEEMRAFLQQRVAAFGALLALLFGMFLVWRLVSTFFADDAPSRAYLPWQAITVAAFSSVWLLCRGRPRSLLFLRVTEVSGLCIAASAAILMCFQVSYVARPDSILLLCMTYTLIVRSIMVPSSARRTLLYGGIFFVPFVLSVFFIHYLKHDPALYTAAADPRLRQDAVTIARRWAVVGALWWIAAVAISTATSKVIYGLHEQVRDARRLGQYTLTEKLGEGGMGVVYLARHALLRRPSAIKLLPPDKLSEEGAARFEREVQLTASLSHPNTIRVFDYGRTPDGIFYYVMEYLEGASLEEVVAVAGALSAGRVIHILDQVAGALSEAHGIGLIHRDIKPANIFLTEQGGVPDVAKVLDFGLVKQLSRTSADASTVQMVTRDTSISGTPTYMAPEAITSPEKIDARTDLYALGAVGYFLLTGHEVFSGRNLLEVCSHHLHSTPPPPSTRVDWPIPDDLERLILTCLEKEPAQRVPDARALQSQLRACRDAPTWSEEEARRWFEAHGPALRARQSRKGVSGTATIAVDLGLRLAGTPDAQNISGWREEA
jgi:serine/threonine-protein kinase